MPYPLLILFSSFLLLILDGGLRAQEPCLVCWTIYDSTNTLLPQYIAMSGGLAMDSVGVSGRRVIRSILYRFDGAEWRAFDLRRYGAPANTVATNLVVDREGTLWVLDYNRSLLHWKRDSTVDVIVCKGCDGELAAAPDGAIVVGEGHRGLVICRNRRVEHFWGEIASDPREQMYLGLVHSLQFDAAGHLWFGTLRGVWRYDGKTFTQYDTRSSALRASINYNIAFDTDGTVWTAGYPPKNLCRYRNGVWEEFSSIGSWMEFSLNGQPAAYCPSHIVLLHDGSVLVGDQFVTAVSIYRNGVWHQPGVPERMKRARGLYPALVDRRGRVWMRTSGVADLVVYDPVLDHPRPDTTIPPPVQWRSRPSANASRVPGLPGGSPGRQ